MALRHQIGVLKRSARKWPKLTPVDRLFWVFLSRVWGGWRSALDVVKPATAIAWHRKGFVASLFTGCRWGRLTELRRVNSHIRFRRSEEYV